MHVVEKALLLACIDVPLRGLAVETVTKERELTRKLIKPESMYSFAKSALVKAQTAKGMF